MQNSIFVVNKEPYCIWEIDVGERNREFLSGIDPEYFSYLAEIHLNADDEKRAAIALRAAFHHALETLFSLIRCLCSGTRLCVRLGCKVFK